jgi:hypothetical protein
MNAWRMWIARALRGPAGGVAVTLLLALVLGGVAMANPGGVPNDHAAHASEAPSQEPSESPDTQDQGSGAPAAHTGDDCTGAVADIQADLTARAATTGLAHAIDVVGANCQKNLQAPGLLVALQHLVTNYQRHQDHEAAKAAARAGATHGQSGASHGHAGEHGPPATGS